MSQPARPRRPVPAPPRRSWELPVLWAMVGGWAVLFAWLSLARHRAFWTGRFDLGNMAQAVWSTAHGRFLETTDIGGDQMSRLAAHVDPLLAVFTPLGWLGATPEALLVAQAVIVALGAVPAFWLGRRWLGGDRMGLAAAAVYLLYPPVQWATVTEFHPVTLAAPLLMLAIWAAEDRRDVLLAVALVLALVAKEQVGLAFLGLGLWMAVHHRRRLAGAVVAVGGVAWAVVAIGVVVPHFNDGESSEFASRYAHLGDGPGGVLRTVVTRPWEAVDAAISPGRMTYLLALLVPLLLLPLLAPLLAVGALPDLALNLLAEWWPQYSIEFQYGAVIAPFLVAAAILGVAHAARRVPAGPLAALLVAVVAGACVVTGPLPWWGPLSAASPNRLDEYAETAHARVMARAVALVPDGAPVSAGNQLGAHLSERRRILTFPVVGDAEWVVVDRRRPAVGFVPNPRLHDAYVAQLLARPDMRVVFDEDGVLVLRRTTPAS